MQMPSFQTWAGRKATALLNQHIDGKAQIDRVMIVFFNKIIVKDAVIMGHEPGDTLVRLNKLSVSFSPVKLIRGDLHLNRVHIRGGVFNYWVEDAEGMSNLLRIFRIPNTPSESTEPIVFPRIGVGELRIRDFRFTLYDPFVPKTGDPQCIDFSNLDLSHIDIQANRIEMGKEGLFVQAKSVKALDKSGFEAVLVKGMFSFIPGQEARIDNLYINDGISEVQGHHLSFGFQRGSDWGDFLDRIQLSADFYDSYLNFGTLGKISPELKNNPFYLNIEGKVKGPIRNLMADQLHVDYEGLDLLINGHITGLPNIQNTHFNLDVQPARVDTRSIEQLVTCFSPTFRQGTLADFAVQIPFQWQASTRGTLNALSIQTTLEASIGGLQAQLQLGNLLNKKPIYLDGYLQTRNLNLGRILATPQMGALTSHVDVRMVLPPGEDPQVTLRNLQVDHIKLLGYNYSNIRAQGAWKNDAINVRAICHDPNLEFLGQAYMTNNPDRSQSLKLFMEVPIVDLSALNLDGRGQVSQASLMTLADLTKTPNHDWLGSIELKQLNYTNSNGKHAIGDIVVNSTQQDSTFQMEFISPMLNASLSSDSSPLVALSEIKRILIEEQFLPHPTQAAAKIPNLNFSLETADTRSLCQIVLPELFLAKGSKVQLSLNQTGALQCNFKLPAIALGDKQIRNMTGVLQNKDSLIFSNIQMESLKINPLDIQNAQIGLTADQGLVHTEIGFANSTARRNELFLSADVFLDQKHTDQPGVWIYINDSYFFIQDNLWDIQPFSLNIDHGTYALDHLNLVSDQQSIQAYGRIGSQDEDLMNLEIQNFDLSAINSFFKEPLMLQGTLNGSANVSALFDNPNVLVDLQAKEVALGPNLMGTLNIKSKWDQTNNRMNMLFDQSLNGQHPLNVFGHYQPEHKMLNLYADLQGLPLIYLNPFLKDVLTTTSGSLNGSLQLSGRLDRLSLTGSDCRFNRFSFIPNYTGVPYILDGEFGVKDGEVTFDNITIYDSNNSRARLEGSLSHQFLSNFYLDTKLSFQNFQCLNTTVRDNDTFYGTANANGTINLRGSFSNLYIDFNVSTADHTSIQVPLSSSLSASQTDLLTFRSSNEILEEVLENQLMKHVEKTNNESHIDIKGRATVNPDAEILIEINKETGDIIRSQGAGTIDIDINPARDVLDLRGDYQIQEGSYRFNLLGVAKDFVVEEGGTVSFGGGISDTRINLKANYNTKASISTLISDTTSVGTRRDVICGIAMTGSLLNPEISFSIDVPDLDPITKGRVESALSTEDKVLRQAISLLLSGSFLPDEQSGIINTSTLLYSYTSEMVSNQLNNIFRQLNIPLDLGLNYQQDQKGGDIFDVSLSTQFFNNRVILNGNVGNNTNQTSSTSSWMGNVDAEIKLSKDGRIRFTLFTHAADDYSNYLDNTQRSGFGFSLQDEFNSAKEFWRNLFWTKKRREEYELQQLIKAEQELIQEQEEIKKRQQIIAPKESPYQFLGF